MTDEIQKQIQELRKTQNELLSQMNAREEEDQHHQARVASLKLAMDHMDEEKKARYVAAVFASDDEEMKRAMHDVEDQVAKNKNAGLRDYIKDKKHDWDRKQSAKRVKKFFEDNPDMAEMADTYDKRTAENEKARRDEHKRMFGSHDDEDKKDARIQYLEAEIAKPMIERMVKARANTGFDTSEFQRSLMSKSLDELKDLYNIIQPLMPEPKPVPHMMTPQMSASTDLFDLDSIREGRS